MKNFYILFICLVLISCLEEPKKTNSTPVTDSSTMSNDSNYKELSKTKKYAYVIIKTEIPKIYNGETYKFSSKVDYKKEESTVYFCSLSFKDTIFVSDILEIEDYDKIEEQNILLNYEDKVKEKISKTDKWLKEVKLTECKNTQDLEKIKENKLESKIIDKQIFIYDSYSEAFINRKKI